MEMRAHVLLQVDPGFSGDAVDYIRSLPSVLHANTTSGAYDVIATAEADSEEALAHLLTLARKAPGLSALRLCRQA